MKRLSSYPVLSTKILLLSAIAFSVFACTKDLYVPPTDDDKVIGEVTIDNYFGYETTKSVQLNINYGKGFPKAYCEVYSENPFEVKGGQVVKRKDLANVGSGFANEDGIYSFPASLPSSVTKVYIYSPDFGVPTLYVADVVNNSISATITFDNMVDLSAMAVQSATTRATKSAITDKIPNTLGEWTSKGQPKYYAKDRKIDVTDALKNYITGTFEEGGDYKGSLITEDADLIVEKEANVWINYFGGSTAAQSTFAYYTYPKGATTAEIREAAKNACVIFPSAHPDALGHYSGVAVQLKYFPKNGTPTLVFPVDTKIGFLLWNNGWTGGNGGAFENNVFYSTASLNNDKRSHTAAFRTSEKGNNYNVVTMEDWGDTDYNDVAFVIQSNPVEAIIVPSLPKPGDRKGTDSYSGLLCFEDNWPNSGDYDMNDVVLKYVSDVNYNYNNEIISITDKFTLTWTGAHYKNGFAYEVPYDLSKATVDVIGQNVNFSKKGNVITLFNDAKAELGVSDVSAEDMPSQIIKEVPYGVSIKFETPISKASVVPPYNPFIKRNNIETHLTNQKPSPSALNKFDKSGADISDGITNFFVCKDGYPFAIHLDGRTDTTIMKIDVTKEGKENRIDQNYPKFAEWALQRDPTIKWWIK